MKHLTLIFLSLAILITKAQARSPVDTHYCPANPKSECRYPEAYAFKSWAALTSKQKSLLETYLRGTLGYVNPVEAFPAWALDNDDRAASFLALTYTLSLTELVFKDGSKQPATDLLIKINRIDGDRIYAELDRTLVKRWQDFGGFIIHLKNGKTETGDRAFVDHTVIGAASLHDGYDVQWWTSSVNVLRLQINYRYQDSEGDIDMDVPVWIWGVIPNPKHNTYGGSDTRQFFNDFTKRYGDPGFKVRERIVKPAARIL